MTHWSDT